MEEMEKQIADFRSQIESSADADMTAADKLELLEMVGMLEILKASVQIR